MPPPLPPSGSDGGERAPPALVRGQPVRHPMGAGLHGHARHRLPGAHLALVASRLHAPHDAPPRLLLVSLPRCVVSRLVSY